jgi:hypothetical protein
LPQASVARYERVTVKRFVHIRLLITSPIKVTEAAPPQLSEEITLAVFGAGTWLAHCTVTLVGHVMEGGILSNTVMS